MAIKVNLEKAYNRLKWDFVKEILNDIGCPSNFVQLIWCCIPYAKMRMLWNREVLEEFLPK